MKGNILSAASNEGQHMDLDGHMEKKNSVKWALESKEGCEATN